MGTREPDVRQGPDVFLSYRRTDKEFVGKLVAVLESLGPSVWWDDEIGGGEDWRDAIIENLASSRCLVIVFSEACNSSKQLRKELAVADHLDKEVIPVLIEQTEPRGFFLYELAPLNWISIHPAPMEKLDSVARLLVERLEATGWTALPVVAPADLPPPPLPAPADGVTAEKSASVPGQPWAAPFAPPTPPEAAAEAGAAAVIVPPERAQDDHHEAIAPGERVDTLPPPSPPPAEAPRPTVAGALPALPDRQHLGLRDVFPFRRVDFILPAVAGVLGLLSEGDVGVRVGSALLFFVSVLAITGLILFPIRYYRRRSNPYRVARNLVISNVVFALVASVAGFLIAETVVEKGDTVNETRVYLAAGFFIFGLLIAAISFVIFFLLSKIRARKAYQESFVQL
jgi:TIR domain